GGGQEENTACLRFAPAESAAGAKREHPSRLLQPRLPFFQQPADVAVAEIEIGQLGRKLDGLGQVAGIRAALGQLKEDFLAGVVLGGRQVLQRLFEVAPGQLPKVALLETMTEVQVCPPAVPRIVAGRL